MNTTKTNLYKEMVESKAQLLYYETLWRSIKGQAFKRMFLFFTDLSNEDAFFGSNITNKFRKDVKRALAKKIKK